MFQTTMIYDGLCRLCQQSRRWVTRLDRQERIALLDARDWGQVQGRFPQLEREALLGAIHVITPDGGVHTGYDGVRMLCRELPAVAWLAPLMGWPLVRHVGPLIYGWVARNRFRLSRVLGAGATCEGDSCRVHGGR